MKNSIRRSPKGFTLIELLIVIAVIAILAAIAIPNLLSSRKAANESSAIASMRTLVSAEETFRSRANPPTYTTLAALNTASLVDPVLGSGTKSGYNFVSTDGSTNTYTATAAPITPGSSGDRYFFVDQTGVIRVDTSAATASSSPIQ